MEIKPTPYERQIFVCTNVKEGGEACCGKAGEEVFRQLRQIAKDKGLHPRIRVAQAKCLGKCNQGVNIMSYPDNVWYSDVKIEDVAKLAEKYTQTQ